MFCELHLCSGTARNNGRHDPITHDSIFYIHFKFSDGSKMKRAFEYHWRYWSIPEVREVLSDVGFGRTDVYWDIAEDEGPRAAA